MPDFKISAVSARLTVGRMLTADSAPDAAEKIAKGKGGFLK